MIRLIASLLVSLFAIGANAGFVHASSAEYELPDVTGHYGIGTISMPIVDKARPGIYADGQSSTYREIMLQIWYPTDRDEKGATSAYIDYPSAAFLRTEAPELPESIIYQLLSIKTHSILNAEVARKPGRFPVLLFSQGFGLFYSVYQILLEDLASHGYIVIGINSPNIAGITSFPDGHSYITPITGDDTVPYVTDHVKDIVNDLKFVAEQLPVLNQKRRLPIAGHMDVQRIGALGHSIGGAGAVQACLESDRIDAAINMDGDLFGDGWKKDMHKPVLLFSSDHEQLPAWTAFWQYAQNGSYEIRLKGSAHSSFSDLLLLEKVALGSNTDVIDANKALQNIRDCVRNFMDSNLKNAQHDKRWSNEGKE